MFLYLGVVVYYYSTYYKAVRGWGESCHMGREG
jgi:hypothetical protein